MSTFLVIDAPNLFFRSKWVVKGSPEEKASLALHVILASLGKLWREQKVNHLVFAFDGKSWRKNIYPPYKANRTEKRAKLSPTDLAQDQLFFDKFNQFQEFIQTKTNCTVLYNSNLEADDLIQGFLAANQTDNHIIVSGDKDFEQLLTPQVSLYDGLTDTTITLHGIYDKLGKIVMDKKKGIAKIPPNPEWSVFEKAMRGCSTDNVFSAYPGVREKGSKNKIGLREAFQDRHKKGFSWSSMMLSRWTDHLGVEHRVLDDYNRNVQLVDLTAQPENIRSIIDETVKDACVIKKIPQVGIHFLRFCGVHELNKISEQSTIFAELLSRAYPSS